MRRSLSTALFVGILGTAGPTFGEPVEVTSGLVIQIIGVDGVFGTWQLIWDRTVVSGGAAASVSPFQQCPPCPLGTSLNLDTVFLPTDFAPGPGRLEIEGNQNDQVFWSGRFEFDSGVLPVTATGGRLPFTFTGTLSGFSTVDRTGTPFFSTELTGVGTASVVMGQGPSGPEVARLFFRFEEVAAVPEPATMVLLGSGLAALAARRRRRA